MEEHLLPFLPNTASILDSTHFLLCGFGDNLLPVFQREGVSETGTPEFQPHSV